MMMDLGYFAIIVGIIAAVLVLAYWAIRLIDHSCKCRETDLEYFYEEEIRKLEYNLEGRNKRQEQERGFKYQKRLQQGQFDRIKTMAPDLVRQINQSVWEEAKKVMKEIP